MLGPLEESFGLLAVAGVHRGQRRRGRQRGVVGPADGGGEVSLASELQVAAEERQGTHDVEGAGRFDVVGRQPHRIVDEALGGVELAPHPGRSGGGAEQLGGAGEVRDIGPGSELHRPVVQVGHQPPQRSLVELDDDVDRGGQVTLLDAGPEGGPEVGQLTAQARVGRRLSRAGELATEAAGQAHPVGRQCPGRGLLLRVGSQLVEREGPHRLEQQVAAARRGLLPGHDRGVDQPGQVAGGIALDGERRAEVLGGIESEPARELGQGSQEPLFGSGEQPVRPLDRRAQGPVTQLRRRPTGLQEVEGPAQAIPEITHAEARCPAGGQLQRQRQTVEPPHDLGHDRGVGLGEDEGAVAPLGVEQERDDRRCGRDFLGSGARRWHGQRAEAEHVLAGQPEWLPRRRQDREPVAGADEQGGQISAVVEHVLAAVEHEDRGADGEALDGRGEQVVTIGRAQAEGGTERVGQPRTVVDRGQLDERDLPCPRRGGRPPSRG